METSNCVVKFVRPGKYADALRAYELYCGERHLGSIRRNGVVECTIPCGPQVLQARIDWAESQPLHVVAEPGRPVVVEVVNNWSPLLALWAVSFGRKSYLTLTESTSA